MKVIVINSPKYGQHDVMVDDEDFERLNSMKWYISNRNGYLCVVGSTKEKLVMSRYIMNTPKGMLCDHKDHNSLNNQKNNLRNCTKYQNQCNRRSAKSSSSSPYLGVYITSGKFGASLRVNGKHIFAGYFPKTPCGEILAALSYDQAALKYHGEFASLNFT